MDIGSLWSRERSKDMCRNLFCLMSVLKVFSPKTFLAIMVVNLHSKGPAVGWHPENGQGADGGPRCAGTGRRPAWDQGTLRPAVWDRCSRVPGTPRRVWVEPQPRSRSCERRQSWPSLPAGGAGSEPAPGTAAGFAPKSGLGTCTFDFGNSLPTCCA